MKMPQLRLAVGLVSALLLGAGTSLVVLTYAIDPEVSTGVSSIAVGLGVNLMSDALVFLVVYWLYEIASANQKRMEDRQVQVDELLLRMRSSADDARDAIRRLKESGLVTQTAIRSQTFAGLDLRDCDFDGLAFLNCDFSGADLTHATFIGASVNGCSFVNSVLVDATLEFRSAVGADFTGARFA